ncbi:hypothetical protein L6452_32502 [Arctium lappa]|uniref:Uncharacterized protein n=1 Tax=Arctium lappa TaxID=4217 RepID=A0ACB8Z5M4_ARCLA|nr:hypothetical protein L6452_32502 [Arctium lappa]
MPCARSGQRSDGRAGDKVPKQTEGCFRCGKPGHFAAECRSSAIKGKPTRDASFYKKKAEYYTQRSLMAEQQNLETDESSDEGDNNALFCGMTEVHSSDDKSELDKKLSFFERETRLLTQEKDKLYLERKSLVSEHIVEKKGLKEKKFKLDQTLKDKVKELKNSESDRLNAISLKYFFQKEREVLHQDFFNRDLLIKRYEDAQKVHEKVNTQIGRRGIGFDDIDPYTGNKRNKSLANIFCPGQFLKPSLPNLLSTFKRRITSEGPHLRKPLQMLNVWYENNDLPSALPSKRKSIPKKYLSQKQIGVFKFGHPETQTQMDFMCMMVPKKELSSDAPEFVPASVEEKLFKRFLESDLRRTYENHFLNQPYLTSEIEEIFEQDLLNCLSVLMVIPCISKYLNVPKDTTNEQSDVFPESHALIHKDFLDTDPESESESSVEVETSSMELEMVTCGLEEYRLPSGILNKIVAPKRRTTGIPIWPDFLDMCLQAKTSIEVENLKNEKIKITQTSKAPKPVNLTKPFQEKLTWQQKAKWPKIDKSNASVAVNARKEGRQGRVHLQSHPRGVFDKRQPRLDNVFCKKKPKSKMGCCKSCSVPSFDNFNEIFKKFTSEVPHCKCFDLVHALNQHFSRPSCFISHPKPENAKFKGENEQNGTSIKEDKSKIKGVKASLKTPNKPGPIWKWVPKYF